MEPKMLQVLQLIANQFDANARSDWLSSQNADNDPIKEATWAGSACAWESASRSVREFAKCFGCNVVENETRQ